MAEVAEAAGRAGARVIQEALGRRTGRTGHVRHKGAVDLVTEVDLAAESAVVSLLAERTPGVPILAEEGGGSRDATTRWIVDPLDGTTNFVHGYPSFAVSVGLEDAGKLVAGCVYDPIRDAAYTAFRGGGARLNGELIRVSEVDSLSDALVVTGFAYDRRERPDFYLDFFRAFLIRAQGMRRLGAAAMDFALLASGHVDGYYEFGLNPWDVAAGVLLVEEAGGRVTDVSCGPLVLAEPRILATNARIHDEMAEVLATVMQGGG